MSERAGVHREAARMHEEAARRHEESAQWWTDLGEQERAEIERLTAALEHSAAALEEARADFDSRDDDAGERSSVTNRALALGEAATLVNELLERCVELELDDEDELVLLLAAVRGSLVQLAAEEGLLDDE